MSVVVNLAQRRRETETLLARAELQKALDDVLTLVGPTTEREALLVRTAFLGGAVMAYGDATYSAHMALTGRDAAAAMLEEQAA